MKKERKKLLVLAVFAVMVCAAACAPDIRQQVTEQLQTAQKYLLDEDYEEAVVAFQKVIELDPKEMQAYRCLAEIYYRQEDLDNCAAILAQAEEVWTNEPDIAQSQPEEYEQLHRLQGELEEKRNMQASIDRVSQEIGNAGPDQLAEIWEVLDTGEEEQLLGDDGIYIQKEDGEGWGLYLLEGICYLYSGEYRDGKREGNGVWTSRENSFLASGEWKDDMPEGNQRVQYLLGTGKVFLELNGAVHEGRWNGPVEMTDLDDIVGAVTETDFSEGVISLYGDFESVPDIDDGHTWSWIVRDQTGDEGIVPGAALIETGESGRIFGITGFADDISPYLAYQPAVQ